MLAQLIYLKNEVRNRSGGQVFTDEKEDNQKKMRRMRFKFLSVMALFLGLSLGFKAYAQPKVVAALTGNKGCVYQTVSLAVINSPGNATGFTWNFGHPPPGNTAPSLSPSTQHFYGTAGAYVVTVTITTPSGPVFAQSDSIYINNLPRTDFVSTNGTIFCNPGTVCFKDNTQPAIPLPGQPIAPIVKEIFLFGDGGITNSLHVPPASRDFCYTYPSPDYNVYTQTIRVTDINGCMDTLRRLNYIYVVGDLGVDFSVYAPIGCAKNPVSFCTDATFTNKTRADVVYPDSVRSFRWDFGDGAFDTTNWYTVKHTYCTNGSFSPRLIVTDINGCSDTFLLANGVKNTSFVFDVDAIDNPVCATPGKICWKQTNVAGASKLWTFYVNANPPFDTATHTYTYGPWKPLSPDPKIFMEDGTFTPCRTLPCGMSRASLKIRAPGCFDTTWVWDTVEVLGPDALIEIPGSNSTAIADSMRFQCHIINPVHFPNNSCHYKDFNVVRLWDFGDKYARQCTTDTRNGINVFGVDTLTLLDPVKYPASSSRPCNCNFSKDSLPVHSYTDWDTLVLRQVSGLPLPEQTMLSGVNKLREYDLREYQCYVVKLMLYDSVNHCGDTDMVSLPLGPPKAGPTGALVVTPTGGTKSVYDNVQYTVYFDTDGNNTIDYSIVEKDYRKWLHKT
ncbi:MAG: hypothetical protein IT247_01310, partial [Bacteroidia bacterium]|nr:hypothetical protein [Bacteroidia bacterium]